MSIPLSQVAIRDLGRNEWQMPKPRSKHFDYERARLLPLDGWEWLVKSIDLGHFPIPIEVKIDRDVTTNQALRLVFVARVQDVNEPRRTITILNDRSLPIEEAVSMSYFVARDFLRREIVAFVLHELNEHLWIGGEREDPHR